MAAPHIDNPFGAKPDAARGPDGTGVIGNKDRKKDGNAEENKAGAIVADKPKCAHPYCNDPSDPSNYPIGLPWASGLLKCLPGYCKKHKKEVLDNAMEAAAEDLYEVLEEDEGDERKTKNVCKCKEDYQKSIVCTHMPEDKPPYKKYIYADDPTVGQELCFFLRMMMVGDELDRWENEERKAQKKEANKRKERKKKRKENKKKVPGTASKTDKSGKIKKKDKTDGDENGGSAPELEAVTSKSSQNSIIASQPEPEEIPPAVEDAEDGGDVVSNRT